MLATSRLTPAVLSLAIAALAPASAAPTAFSQIGLREAVESPVFNAADPLAMDVDEDGRVDLVYANEIGLAIEWVRATGPGTFARPQTLAVSNDIITRLRAGDVDSDGDSDLICVIDESQLAYVQRRATGFASLMTPIGDPLDGTLDVTLADQDGDGDADVILSRVLGNSFPDPMRISVMLSAGGGVFGPERTILDTPMPWTGYYPRIVAADISGDRAADLILHRDFRLEYWESTGSASFAPPVVLDPQISPVTAIVVDDLDGDGVLDVAAGVRWVRTYRGLGGGAFSGPTEFQLDSMYQSITDLLARDVDDDGDLDLLLPMRLGVEVAENLGAGAFADGVGLTLDNSLIFSGRLHGFACADWTGDGLPDLLACQDAEASFSVVHLYPREAQPQIDAFEEAVPLTLLELETPSLGAADMDGDGGVELLSGSRHFPGQLTVNRVLDERATDPVTVELVGVEGIEQVVGADLNGDLRDDVILVDETEKLFVLEGLGGAAFGPPQLLGGAGTSVLPRLVDVDGDGRRDLAHVSPDEQQVLLRAGSGDGSFGAPQVLYTSSQRIVTIRLADMDADGRVDLVVSGLGGVFWVQNLGTTFAVPVELSDPQSDDATGLAVGDWNGDSILDVVWTDDVNFDGPFVALGMSGGSFAPAFDLILTGQLSRYDIELADLDENGVPDLIAIGNEFVVYWNGQSSGQRLSQLGTATRLVVRDLDTDGDLDLGFIYSPHNSVAYRENFLASSIGTTRCSPAVTNVSNHEAMLRAYGSDRIADNDVTLFASLLVPGPTLFLASPGFQVTFPVQNSQGRLCLAPPIGRYVGPGEVASVAGEALLIDRAALLRVDVGAIPTPVGLVPAVPGDTWYFQAWYRDFATGVGPSSNFTDALELTFQ